MIFIYDVLRVTLLLVIFIMLIHIRRDVELDVKQKLVLYFLYMPFFIYFGGVDSISDFPILAYSDYYPYRAVLVFLIFFISFVFVVTKSKNVWLRFSFLMPIIQCLVVFYLNLSYESRSFSLFFKSWFD